MLNSDQIRAIQTCVNEKILKKLNKAVVFVDTQFVEWFNLTVGLDALIRSGGAHNIKEFGPFQNGGESLKAVILISKPLKGIVLDTLKEILISSKFQFLTLITNVNPECYEELSSEEEDYFDQIRDQCLMWMSNAVKKKYLFCHIMIQLKTKILTFSRITHARYNMRSSRLFSCPHKTLNRPIRPCYF
jgi:hypothetical protein